MSFTIAFTKGHDCPGGLVSGRLERVEPAAQGELSFLAELSDVHPEFAAHVVKAVNTYSALQSAIAAQGPDGAVARALRDLLAASNKQRD